MGVSLKCCTIFFLSFCAVCWHLISLQTHWSISPAVFPGLYISCEIVLFLETWLNLWNTDFFFFLSTQTMVFFLTQVVWYLNTFLLTTSYLPQEDFTFCVHEHLWIDRFFYVYRKRKVVSLKKYQQHECHKNVV